MSTLTLPALVIDLKFSLLDAADKFTSGADLDFRRHLREALQDLNRVRPRTATGSFTLIADEPFYAAPADLVQPKFSRWGESARRQFNYWDDHYPKSLPRMTRRERNGAVVIELDPAPSADEISRFGSSYEFFYVASHSVTDNASTVQDCDRGLLLLRAQAEAMKELAHRGVGKPVQLRDGMTSAPKNGTPAALFDQLMREFERQAA
jgi:hypothetical protein